MAVLGDQQHAYPGLIPYRHSIYAHEALPTTRAATVSDVAPSNH